MASTHKTLSLSTIKQLVDLNGDSANFDISFKVSSHNGEPFDIVIVDQTTLDNSAELDYKKALNGTMSGKIVQDKNEYQNYFLCLRADQPCNVDVEIEKKDPPPPVAPTFVSTPPPDKPNNSGWWKIILIGIVVVLGAGLLYYMYNRTKNSDLKPSSPSTPLLGSSPMRLRSPGLPPVPQTGGSPIGRSPQVISSPINQGNNLLQRLKALHVH